MKKKTLQKIAMKFNKSLGHLLKIYFTKLENLKEMSRFQDSCELPKLNQDEINNLVNSQ